MRLALVGSTVAVAIVASLAGCDEASKFAAVKSEMAGEPSSAAPAKLPPPGPPAVPPGSQCSFEESQRLTTFVEKGHAVRLRELAEANSSSALTMVPMRLHYDESGAIDKVTVRLDGHMEFVAAAVAEAKTWRLEGIKEASTCDVAVRIPAAP